jgi:hypothetical protein
MVPAGSSWSAVTVCPLEDECERGTQSLAERAVEVAAK